MKNLFKTLYALAFTTTLAFVGSVEAETNVQFGIGYRSDDINWKVKAPDEIDLETHSKLSFRDIEIFTLNGKIKGVCGDCAYYRVDAQYGWVLDGVVRESDQFAIGTPVGGGVTIVSAVTRNDIRKKYVADFNIGIGYPLQQCWFPNLQVIPTLGFAYDTQRIRSKNNETIRSALDDGTPGAIPLRRLGRGASNHRFTWWGPWVGLDLALCHQECWNLYSEFQYHFGTRARRERNSRVGYDYFDDYERTKSADGVTLKVGSTFSYRCNWLVGGFVVYKSFTSNEHHDKLRWRSIGVGLELGYLF